MSLQIHSRLVPLSTQSWGLIRVTMKHVRSEIAISLPRRGDERRIYVCGMAEVG